jgi:mono/diheme cytochrome c family protein
VGRARWARTLSVWAVAAVFAAGRADGRASQQSESMATLEQGEKLYLSRCVSCHGVDGDAIPKIGVLTGQFRRAYTDAELVTIIRNGITGTAMAPTTLTEEQARLVVAYLRWAAGPDEIEDEAAPARTGVIGDPDRGRALDAGRGRPAVERALALPRATVRRFEVRTTSAMSGDGDVLTTVDIVSDLQGLGAPDR